MSRTKFMKRRHRHSRFSAGQLQKLIENLLCSLFIIAPLLIGGTLKLGIIILVIIIWFIFFLTLYHLSQEEKKLHIPLIGWGFITITLYTLFQTIPLPPSWLEIISPKAYEIRSLVIPNTLMSWWPISFEPGLTLHEFYKWTGLTVLFLTLKNIVGHHNYRKIYISIFLSGIIVAAIGLLQKALGIHKIFGSYDVPAEDFILVSTFVNPNHLAGFLNICLPLGLALAVTQQQVFKKIIAYIGVFLIGITTVLTFSRSGIVCFILSGYGFIILYNFFHVRKFSKSASKEERQKELNIIFGIITLFVFTFFAEALLNEVIPWFNRGFKQYSMSELKDIATTSDKIETHKYAIPLIKDYALTGIGKGSQGVLYGQYIKPKVSSSERPRIHTHAENIVFQLFIDYGVIVGIIIMSICIISFIIYVRHNLRHTFGVASITAVGGMFIHDLFDFSLEIYGVSFAFMAVLAIFTKMGHSYEHTETTFLTKIFSPIRCSIRHSLFAFSIFSLISLICIPLQNRESLLFRRYPSIQMTSNITSQTISEKLLHFVTLHPADFNASYVTGHFYLSESVFDLKKAIQWLNKSVYLNPTISEPHLLLAKIYYLLGQHISAKEQFRLGISYHNPDQDALRRLWKDLIKNQGIPPSFLANALPINEDGSVIEKYDLMFARFLADHQIPGSLTAYEMIEKRQKPSFDMLVFKAHIMISEKQFKQSESLLLSLMQKQPHRIEPYKILSMIYKEQGQEDSTIVLLEKGYQISKTNNSPETEFLEELFFMYLNSKKLDLAQSILDEWNRFTLSSNNTQKTLRYAYFKGLLAMKHEKYSQAIKEFLFAMRLEPENYQWPELIAQCHESNRSVRQAISYYEMSLKLQPSEQIQAKLNQLQNQLIQ